MHDCEKSKPQLNAELPELQEQLTRLEEPLADDTGGSRAVAPSVGLPSVRGMPYATQASSKHPTMPYAQLAEALCTCEARLAEVQRVAKLGYYSYDIGKDTIYRSQALLDMLGIEADHPTDTAGWLALVHPDQRAMMAEYLTTLIQQRQNFDKEYQIIHGKSGQVRWVHGLGQLRLDGTGEPVELFGTIQDITERKAAEEALVKSELTYRELIDGMNETVWVIGADEKFIDVNRTASEMLQYSREELLTMGPLDIDPSITKVTSKQREHSFAQNRIRIFESTHTRKDGKRIPIEIQSTKVTYNGQAATLSIARDITERKQAEAALQKSETTNRLLAAVVHQAREAIVITDLQGNIDYVNPAHEAMTGYTANELLGQELRILPQGEPVDQGQRTPWATIQQHKTWTGRFVDERKDGSRYHKDVTLFPIHDADRQIINYCQIARDVSHELQLERQLNQAQRLETIGTLAGGIAHDFNNILMPMMGYAEMAAVKLPATDPLQTNIQQIIKGTQRARELVRQILTFSRQHELQRRPLYLHVVVEEALKLMRPSLPTTIEIRADLDLACEKVLADATQLHQVIVNLCTNAFHAMEATGGVLTITLAQVVIDQPLAQLHPNLRQKDYARLTVSDTGTGMDNTTLERIFEPFFTTKPVDRGTGLGLSVAHGIIRSHDGALFAQSEVGKGSTFQIYLPIFSDDTDPGTEHGALAAPGKEMLLLVDDEPTITEIMKVMLEWLGYQVETYNSSLAALAAFQQHPQKYDLVLSDLAMPDMTGVDLAGQLQQVRAGTPVIIVTGYGNHLDEKTQQRNGIRHVAGKPIVINELALLIRQVLDT